MRTVAKFQFVAPVVGDGADRIVQIIENWSNNKFQKRDDGSTIIQKSGLTALFDRRDEKVNDTGQTTFLTLEPVPNGQLQTQVRNSDNPHPNRIPVQPGSRIGRWFTITQRRHSIPHGSVRELFGLDLEWRLADGGERIFSKCFEVKASHLSELEALITAPIRRLPLILVSELQGETIAGDIH